MNKRIDKSLIEIAKEINDINSLSSYQREQISDIIQNLNNREFRITVVGEFSSGKSTFLNAIIGKDILPHGVKETTATVTYIHNVSKTDQRIDKAYIHFNNGDDDISVDLTKNALVDYVTTSENKYKVIEEISSVDIYVHFVETEENILIIDTPGMNGMAEGHQALTIKEIQQSHASICLFPIRGIGDSDFQFLKELITYQNTFFFILNRIDEINTTEVQIQQASAKLNNKVKENLFRRQKVQFFSRSPIDFILNLFNKIIANKFEVSTFGDILSYKLINVFYRTFLP